MTSIVTTEKIDDKNYNVYLNGYLRDKYYNDAYFGGLVLKSGSWILVQNTYQGENEEIDYHTYDLDEALWDIDCEVIDCEPDSLDDLLELQ